MSTPLGEYLNKQGIVKEKVRNMANIKKPRMNDLCNKATAKPSPEEFYKIICSTIKLAGLPPTEFTNAVEAVFPNRPNPNFLDQFDHLPVEVRFLKKYTLKHGDIESTIGMAANKISRLATNKTKDLLAVELICFIEGLELDVLEIFKEFYGEIE